MLTLVVLGNYFWLPIRIEVGNWFFIQVHIEVISLKDKKYYFLSWNRSLSHLIPVKDGGRATLLNAREKPFG